MGYTTDFLGHIDIAPALNQDELEYLSAFSLSRRFARPDGPYAVPGNPMAALDSEPEQVDVETYNQIAPGQPQLWCQWVPCFDGCCLSFDGNEKFYRPIEWMRYLIQHFLKPGAVASKTGLPAFEHFTFDHQLNGIVVGCRRDTKQLYAINVKANRVTEKVLREGRPDYYNRPPLPYEEAIDRAQQDSRRRRRVPPSEPPEGVVDLASRRAQS
jgi:hypothetical protein